MIVRKLYGDSSMYGNLQDDYSLFAQKKINNNVEDKKLWQLGILKTVR